MNFSEIVQCSLVSYSHSGEYLAVVKKAELYIYQADGLEIEMQLTLE